MRRVFPASYPVKWQMSKLLHGFEPSECPPFRASAESRCSRRPPLSVLPSLPLPLAGSAELRCRAVSEEDFHGCDPESLASTSPPASPLRSTDAHSCRADCFDRPSNRAPMRLATTPSSPPLPNPFLLCVSDCSLCLVHRSEYWEWAIQNSRCLMCGAEMPAAHRSAAPKAYPKPSKSARTRESHRRPSGLATCSPNVIVDSPNVMSSRNAGQRCRSSESPFCFPAQEKGWHGHEPVLTGLSSGQWASLRASGQPSIPQKKCCWANPAISYGRTSRIDRQSTSPSGTSPARISSFAHAQILGSESL